MVWIQVTDFLHRRTRACLRMQRQMCATTQKWAQVYATRITAPPAEKAITTTTTCLITVMLRRCIQNLKKEYESLILEQQWQILVSCGARVLASVGYLAAEVCKQNGHYTHYLRTRKQWDTLRGMIKCIKRPGETFHETGMMRKDDQRETKLCIQI